MRTARIGGRLLVAGALGVALFGWIDLVATWRLDEDTTSYDLAYGGLTGLMLPAAFLAAAPAQVYAGAFGYAAAGVAGGQLRYLVLAAVVSAAAWLLLGLPRDRLSFDVRATVAAAVATPPLVVLAVHALQQERARVTSEAHAGLHAWAGVAAFAIAAALVAWLAAAGVRPRLSAWTVGLAVAYFGVGSIVDPHAAASVGAVWGALAIAWSAAVVAVAEARG